MTTPVKLRQPKHPMVAPETKQLEPEVVASIQGNFEDSYERISDLEVKPRYVVVSTFFPAQSGAATTVYMLGSSGSGLEIPFTSQLTEMVLTASNVPGTGRTVTVGNVDSGDTASITTGVGLTARARPDLDFGIEESVSAFIDQVAATEAYSLNMIFTEVP